ncbi:MAG: hypothetical protein JO256_09830 [Alphaproteobacteria bacterium]|nr:hypothetical protein [Alphaproteobacteria bacterium]
MQIRAKRHLKNGLLALALSALPALADDKDIPFQDFQFTGTLALEYSSGNYGTTRNTNVQMALPVLSVETGDFKFSASMPYMRIAGRGLVIFDAAGNPIIVNRRTTLPPIERNGFGDLNLSATYALPPSFLDDFAVKLTVGAKLSTASARRRLSTGETDFGLSLDVSKQFGAWGPFLTAGYLWAGKSTTFTLYNTASVSVGTSYEISDDLVAVVSYDYDSSGDQLVSSSKALFGSLSWVRSDGITLTGYSTVGLSSGSPAFGAGLLLSYGLN